MEAKPIVTCRCLCPVPIATGHVYMMQGAKLLDDLISLMYSMLQHLQALQKHKQNFVFIF